MVIFGFFQRLVIAVAVQKDRGLWERVWMVFGFKKWHSRLDFYFMLSFLPSFFAFLASFFSLSEHLVSFILVGKVFRKAFRILGLDERKSWWVVEQDFHGNFQVNVIWLQCYIGLLTA